jgi:hypothetical protein
MTYEEYCAQYDREVALAKGERTCVDCDENFVPLTPRQIRCTYCQVQSDFA